MPTLSITGNSTLHEFDAKATLTISLSKTSELPVYVDIATFDESTHSLSDYISEATTIIFTPGMSQITYSIDIINDKEDESNEVFNVILSNAVNATIKEAKVAINIIDDDIAALDEYFDDMMQEEVV